MRNIATKAYNVANRAYDLAALPVFVAMLASVVLSFFVGDQFGRDLFRYIVQPLGWFVVLRWIGRWAWRRYQAAPGIRGFIPHKTPWAP